MKLADRCMCQCGYLVPIAPLRNAEMGPSFLGCKTLSNSCASCEQDLNTIRKRWEEYEGTIARHLECHVNGDIGGPA